MEEDSRLVERFQSGEKGSFDDLVRRHYQRVCNILFHVLGTSSNVEDLAQEVFLKAYHALPFYRGQSAFSTWLYRIAVNAGLDELRRQKRRRIFSFSRLDEPTESRKEIERSTSDGPQPDKEIERQELAEIIERAMRKLPEKLRVVSTLRDIEGFSYGEIAEMLQCSIGTVKSRLFYARAKLRRLLKSYL